MQGRKRFNFSLQTSISTALTLQWWLYAHNCANNQGSFTCKWWNCYEQSGACSYIARFNANLYAGWWNNLLVFINKTLCCMHHYSGVGGYNQQAVVLFKQSIGGLDRKGCYIFWCSLAKWWSTPCGMDRGVVPPVTVAPSTHHHGSM